MAVHIALIGRTLEPVVKGFHHYGSVDKLYLLHSPDNPEFKFKGLALDLKRRLAGISFDDVVLVQIDAFDMLSVVNEIVKIARVEPAPVYINITGGTNLMAGAACAASFFVGGKAYYVQGKVGSDLSQSSVIELPIPNIPRFHTLDKKQLMILRQIDKAGGIVLNVKLLQTMDISPQKLSYHIKELERKGLLIVSRSSDSTHTDKRFISLTLTNAGKLVISWAS